MPMTSSWACPQNSLRLMVCKYLGLILTKWWSGCPKTTNFTFFMVTQISIFWRRFAAQEPDHPVFAAGCSLPFSRVIPFLAHGDEGRTRKKKGIMLWSMHGIVGSGTRFFKQKTAEEQMFAMGLNLDNSFCSRFLHAAVPNKLYKENEPLWHELAEKIGSAYFRLQTTGFQHKGKTWFAACVGLTGDAPFLSKAGCLQRSFARVPKKPRDEGSGRLQKEPAGICFLCLAGKTRVPFEDLGKSPKWLQSMAEAPLPWIGCPPLLRGLRESRPHFLKYDIWHNFHGGLGKHFIASPRFCRQCAVEQALTRSSTCFSCIMIIGNAILASGFTTAKSIATLSDSHPYKSGQLLRGTNLQTHEFSSRGLKHICKQTITCRAKSQQTFTQRSQQPTAALRSCFVVGSGWTDKKLKQLEVKGCCSCTSTRCLLIRLWLLPACLPRHISYTTLSWTFFKEQIIKTTRFRHLHIVCKLMRTWLEEYHD